MNIEVSVKRWTPQVDSFDHLRILEAKDGEYVLYCHCADLLALCQQQHEALENLAHGKSGKSRGSEWDDAESALDAYDALFPKTGGAK